MIINPISDPYTLGLARFSGVLSASSSSLIIFIITRSIPRFSIVYHRIMFGMSISDILASISIALTTIPMPKDLPVETTIPDSTWLGLRLGNTSTCNAQGFLIIFGMASMFMFNSALWIYYTCTAAIQMDEQKIVKRVEPFLLLTPVAIALTFAINLLRSNAFGISAYRVCCTVVRVGDLRVNPGADINNELTRNILIGFLSIVFALCIVCFLLIIFKVYRTDKDMSATNSSSRIVRISQAPHMMPRARESYHNTKVILVQAISYILTMSISFAIGILVTIHHDVVFLRFAYSIFPLQGFFNLVIFISHKICNYRRANPSVSICSTLRPIINGQYQEPIFPSRVPYVFYQRDANWLEDQLDDENGSENDFRDSGSSDNSGLEVYFDEDESYIVNDHSENLFPIAEESSSGLDSLDGF